jgi:hypothetical protein
MPQRDCRSLKEKFDSSYLPEPNSGCWIWLGTVQGGRYGAIWFGGKFLTAHRVAWELNNKPIPDGMVACHKCDTPLCVNPRHIFIGTQADNVADMEKKGRANKSKGDAHLRAKIKSHQIPEIIQRRKNGEYLKSIAKDFAVSYSTISAIVRGVSWKSVQKM